MPKVILIAAITGFLISTALLACVTWYADGLRLVLASCAGRASLTQVFTRSVSLGAGV
jgi:hypothetical protein